MRVADHSALFTLASMRIRQNPELLDRLYRLGAPKDAYRVQAPTAPFLLTSHLLLELGRETARRNAPLAVFLPDSQAPLIDTAALREAGIRVEVIPNRISEEIDMMSIRFKNDGHYNELGNRLLAERMEPVAAKLLLSSQEPGAPLTSLPKIPESTSHQSETHRPGSRRWP